MATHSRIQLVEGSKQVIHIPGSQRPASQVINHRTISRRLPAAKHSTVSDDVPVTREVFEKEESLSSGQRSSCWSLPGLPHHPGKICFAAGSLFSRDEWLSRPSHRPGPGLPPSRLCFVLRPTPYLAETNG